MIMQDHEYRTEQSSLRTLAPVPLLLDIVRRWYLIIIVTLLVAMGAYMVSDATYKPVYTTNTTFVVSVRDSSSTVYQNLSATTNLATVFTEVLNSSLLRGDSGRSASGRL